MKKAINNALYYILFSFWYCISLLPLGILYLFSDFLYLLIYHVAHYRRKVVINNLTSSFPDKSEKEINEIAKQFYAWFCDYIVESIKLLSMSEKEAKKRMRFEGSELIRSSIDSGHSFSLYLGHYCNWEWITTLPITMGNIVQFAQIYHPLENEVMNRLFLHLRGRFGSVSVEMEKSFRTIVSWYKEKKLNGVGYIADQVPGYQSIHCWIPFLNHPDTPVFTGGERITRITESHPFYGYITRPKRGYYVCKFIPIEVDKDSKEKYLITKGYFKLLEQNINDAPQYWLWSHNRWKRTREVWEQMFTEEEKRRMMNR